MRPGQVGHFRDDAARARFVAAYQASLRELPPPDAQFDVPTALGSVRAYRFSGPAGRPVVLLPGRNASTPMWAPNMAGLLARRTVIAVDLLGEPGMSVQQRAICGPEDQSQWFDELLDGLGVASVHLMGVSFGGWTAANYAVRRPGKVASLVLLDPVLTFAPIPVRTMLAVAPMGLPWVPDALRRRILRWISGGADVDDSVPVAALIAAGSREYVLRQPMPVRFTDGQLRTLDIPVLALIAGRSVIHDPVRAAAAANRLLRRGEMELWSDASHALTGEYPNEIADRAHRFWVGVDDVT